MNCFLLCLFFLCGCFSSMYSQSTSSTYYQQLDSVTVTTPSKIPLKAKRLMRHVDIIEETTLSESLGRELGQVLTMQPGLIVNGAYSNTGAIKSLFLDGAASNATLILLDGIPITDVSGSGAAFDWRFLYSDNISRIEILRGSRSVLYGSNAVAGAINIISKKASERRLDFGGGFIYGAYDTYGGHAFISGSLGKLAYRVSYNRKATNGISAATMPDGTPPSSRYKSDAFLREQLSAELTYQPSSFFSITPFFKYHSIPTLEYDAGAFVDGQNSYSSIMLNAGFRSKLRLRNVDVNVLYGANRLERTFNATFFKQRSEGVSHSVDAYAASSKTSLIRWLGGVHFQLFHLLDTVLPNKPSAYSINPYINFVLGGEEKQWSAELGARLVYHSQYELDIAYNIAAGYTLSEAIYMYANYARSFIAPTLSQLYGRFGANPSIDPEVSHNVNVGLRVNLLNDKLLLEGSWFSRTSTSKIVYALIDPANRTYQYLNRDYEELGGAEIKATYRPNEKWQFSGWYNYTDGKLNEKNEAGRDTSYFHLIRRPRNSLGVNIKFRPQGRWLISLNATYYGTRSDRFYNAKTFSTSNVQLHEYALLNTYVSYEAVVSHLTFYVQWDNITHASFFETYGYNSLGSMLTVGVRFNY